MSSDFKSTNEVSLPKESTSNATGNIQASIWAEMQAASVVLGGATGGVQAYAARNGQEAENRFEEHGQNRFKSGAVELKLTPAEREAHKIEDLYKDTLRGDDKLRQEAYACMQKEGKSISQNPAFKDGVTHILQKDLKNLLIVDHDAQGNPEDLRFKSRQQMIDENALKMAKALHDKNGIAAANRRVIMDDIGGGEIVTTLSPGQKQVVYDR